MNFENVFIGPQSIQVCHLRSKTPLTSVDRLRGPPRPIQRGRWPPHVPRRSILPPPLSLSLPVLPLRRASASHFWPAPPPLSPLRRRRGEPRRRDRSPGEVSRG